ncbi:hypothetical protein PAPYR_4033 [Paratrimastix pyriformis]|uniref:Uncharacterized protein n=1 Tax=Paratrimastix pyriformis TaxID=342808 RepID=A0ABQ8UL83_9EUKA|nr:hypothetical protein PAPYR_4033 [Paratrimastix pyriformis]
MLTNKRFATLYRHNDALWAQYFIQDNHLLRAHVEQPPDVDLADFVERGSHFSADAATRYGLSPYGFEASYKLYVTAVAEGRAESRRRAAEYQHRRRKTRCQTVCGTLWIVCVPLLAALFAFLVMLGLAYDNTVSFTVSLAPILAYCLLFPIVVALFFWHLGPLLIYLLIALAVPLFLLPALYADGVMHPSYHLVLIPWYLLVVSLALLGWDGAISSRRAAEMSRRKGLTRGCKNTRRLTDAGSLVQSTHCEASSVALVALLMAVIAGCVGLMWTLLPVAALVAAILLYGLTRDGVICAFPGGHLVAFVPLFVLCLLATGGLLVFAGVISASFGGRRRRRWEFDDGAGEVFQRMLKAEAQRWRDEGREVPAL